MANIAITNFCNLKCDYCFADDMIQETSKAMSLDDYKYVLDMVKRSNEHHIGIIGGEPTLHPHFDQIIEETNKFCRDFNVNATLFTNGIKLKQYIPKLGQNIHILVNMNHPSKQKADEYRATIESLEKCYELGWVETRISIGCNVYPTLTDYDYIWDICKRFGFRGVRTSVVSPGGCFRNMREDKHKYFEIMKPIFLKHCEDALCNNITLRMDCGHIPTCYFSEQEMQLVEKVTENYKKQSFCEPVIDITGNLKATACFGTYDPVDIRCFDTLEELRRYLLVNRTIPRALNNTQGRCADCKNHELLKCQGGCLGFAKVVK